MKTLALIFLTLSLPQAWGKKKVPPSLTGFQVMEKVDKNNKKLKTMSSEVLMTIIRGKDTRERNFYHLKKYQNDVTKSLIKFFLPPTVKGTSLLTHSKDDKNSKTQWIYLPALKALTQIRGERENESFMGSDFTYSDVAGRQLNQDQHILLKETSTHYLVKSVPKEKKDIYSKILLNISKKSFVPGRVVFYDKNGKIMKELKNQKIKKFGSLYLVTDAVMKNSKNKGQTRLSVSEIKLNIPISDRILGVKGLRR